MESIASSRRSTRGVDAGMKSSTNQLQEKLFAPVDSQLRDVERMLAEQLQSRHQELQPILRHGALLGGKRLRPALLLLVGSACGGTTEKHVILATVLEMVHTATLVHDDVLDGAAMRRHLPTVNAKWSSQTSILLGDYLFAESYTLAASAGSTEACRLIGEASRRVCEGEMRQLASQGDVSLSETQYLEIIQAKTAELCGVACCLGSQFSGASDDVVDALETFGRSLGVAFQIADDYLDLWGDGERLGKTLGTDILQAKMTLPLIHAFDVLPAAERAALRSLLHGPPSDRLPAVFPYLERAGAAEYTRRQAESFIHTAVQTLEVLPESDAKATLQSCARFAINRPC